MLHSTRCSLTLLECILWRKGLYGILLMLTHENQLLAATQYRTGGRELHVYLRLLVLNVPHQRYWDYKVNSCAVWGTSSTGFHTCWDGGCLARVGCLMWTNSCSLFFQQPVVGSWCCVCVLHLLSEQKSTECILFTVQEAGRVGVASWV